MLKDAADEACVKIISAADPSVDKELLGTRLSDRAFTDILYISKDNTMVAIEAVKKIAAFFAVRSHEKYGVRFAYIEDGDIISEAAQNALLKIMEEPPAERYIFILASGTDNLLPTVLSRVQKIKAVDTNAEEAAENDDIIYIYEHLCAILLEGDLAALFETSLLVSRQRDDAVRLLNDMYRIFLTLAKGEDALQTVSLDLLSDHVSRLAALRMCDFVQNGLRAIKRNASVRLAVENTLISILEEYNAENSRDQV